MALAALGVLGVVLFTLALLTVQRLQFNVVKYAAESSDYPRHWPSLMFALLAVAGIVALAVRAGVSRARKPHRLLIASSLWPLVLGCPLACYAFVDAMPPFALSFLMILGGGWAAFRAAAHVPTSPPRPRVHVLAVGSIILLIALLTVVHTRIQINFFEHFMLGHADFGHFTEEFKNALLGRGLRSDSFDNTRLGWHFVPLLYLLMPGYALWPSPVYLMVCSALFVHVVALPAYYLARRLSGSAAVGWMWAVAWLLLPSQSRLVYSNTYGFQWIYFAMPLLGFMIGAGVIGRWRTCLILVAVVLLCKETATVATFGWGLYVTFFTPRRRTGVVIMVVSAAYFLVCANVLIPHFSAAGRYQRLDLFGELGTTLGDLLGAVFTKPDVLFARLARREVLYFLVMLLMPMALLPLRGWRVAIAAFPTLVFVLLLQNEQWLGIKFWHQATFLPFLFFAGIASMRSCRDDDPSPPGRLLTYLSGQRALSAKAAARGMAVAALFCAALGHYFYGFSPISKSYEPYAAAEFLHRPDPRMETVRRLRADIPKDRTILATERLAAHFTDYKRLYTGRRILPAGFVIIDRHDTWDTSGLPQQVGHFADHPDYRLYGEFGGIVVFERRPDTPPLPPD